MCYEKKITGKSRKRTASRQGRNRYIEEREDNIGRESLRERERERNLQKGEIEYKAGEWKGRGEGRFCV